MGSNIWICIFPPFSPFLFLSTSLYPSLPHPHRPSLVLSSFPTDASSPSHWCIHPLFLLNTCLFVLFVCLADLWQWGSSSFLCSKLFPRARDVSSSAALGWRTARSLCQLGCSNCRAAAPFTSGHWVVAQTVCLLLASHWSDLFAEHIDCVTCTVRGIERWNFGRWAWKLLRQVPTGCLPWWRSLSKAYCTSSVVGSDGSQDSCDPFADICTASYCKLQPCLVGLINEQHLLWHTLSIAGTSEALKQWGVQKWVW